MAQSQIRPERLVSGFGLIEGPLYEPGHGLLFSDTINGGVRCLGADGALIDIVAHRKGIGGLARHIEGGLIVSGRTVACKPADGGATITLVDDDPDHGILGFNDLVTDPAGRIYVGSLAFRALSTDGAKPAFLHMIDLDGTVHMLADDVMLTNGLGFSPNGDKLYHSDSARNSIYAYDVDRDGRVSNRQVFAKTRKGSPDGLAVAADGSVWVALAHGSGVGVYNPEGREINRIDMPVPMVTSLCFGGDDWRDLYIVTGRDGAPEDEGGGIYRLRVDVPGKQRPLARVRLP